MAQSYNGIKARYPGLPHEELMAGALARRNTITWLPGHTPQGEQAVMLEMAGGRFAALVELIARRENPKAFDGISPELLHLARDVINEVLEEQIPGYDRHSM